MKNWNWTFIVTWLVFIPIYIYGVYRLIWWAIGKM